MQIRERPRQLAPAAGDLLSLQRRQQLVDREGSREVRAFPGTPHWGLTSSSSLRVPFLPGSFESSSVLMSLQSGGWMLPQGTAHPVFPRVPHKLCQRSLCPRGILLLRLTDRRLPCPPPPSSPSSPAAHLWTPPANEVSSRPGLHLYPCCLPQRFPLAPVFAALRGLLKCHSWQVTVVLKPFLASVAPSVPSRALAVACSSRPPSGPGPGRPLTAPTLPCVLGTRQAPRMCCHSGWNDLTQLAPKNLNVRPSGRLP